MDKRIPPDWVEACYQEQPAFILDNVEGAPALTGLAVWLLPIPGRQYVLGADPAEGNPTSHESAAAVLDAVSGEQVAELAGRFQPETFASYCCQLAGWYNRAALMIERNNHGHAVILWVRQNGRGMRILDGRDGRPGWLESALGKSLLYDACADAFRNRETTVHSFPAAQQLAAIDGSKLSAPADIGDDRATGYALAPTQDENLFSLANVDRGMTSIIDDIRNPGALTSAVRAHRPQIVVHMAAQSLVRESYRRPIDTYATNVVGTLNVLEAVRAADSVRVVLIVTSDKCYKNSGSIEK